MVSMFMIRSPDGSLGRITINIPRLMTAGHAADRRLTLLEIRSHLRAMGFEVLKRVSSRERRILEARSLRHPNPNQIFVNLPEVLI